MTSDHLAHVQADGLIAAARRVQAGEQDPCYQLPEMYAAIETDEGWVRAWAHLRDPAYVERDLLAGRQGPLAGTVVGVKDIIDTWDMPTAYGSEIYADHRPARDAGCVALLREAGAAVLGKTITTEFALWTPGPTVNPHDVACTPGGSSSGSAAAVAAGMVPCAVGTQTGGSIILPAAYCGVVGYKPTFGLVGTAGVWTLSQSLDTVGVFATTVSDAAALARALAGRPIEPAVAPKLRPRIGLVRSEHWDVAEPVARQTLGGAADGLANAGADVVEVELPSFCVGLDETWRTIVAREVFCSLAHEASVHRDRLSAELGEFLQEGQAVASERYDAAQAVARQARFEFSSFASRFDALLTLSSLGEAVRSHDTIGSGICNRAWTLLHGPCVQLPVSTGPSGLPVGVQLVGPRDADDRVLAAAGWANRVLAPESPTTGLEKGT